MYLLAVLSLAVLAATWVGYPLVVWALARTRRPRPLVTGPETRPVTVTVLLASREGDDAIRDRVLDLLSAEYPRERLDVVVAIDASRHEPAVTGGLVGDGRVSVVGGDLPGGKAAALNAAVRRARGDVLVFADTAQRFGPGTVAALCDELARRPELGAVSGALEIEPGEPLSAAGWYWRFERWLRETEARLHSPVGVTGAVYAMRRTDWEPLPAGLILDDLYVPMRLVLRGQKIGFRSDAIAVDRRRIDPRAEYRRKARTLTGVFQLCHLMPSVLVPLRNPIWLQFVFHKLLRLFTPWLLVALAIAACWWVLASLPVHAALAALGAALVAVALLLAFAPRVRRLAGEALAMQAAAVKATRNALRGEWDVWRR